MPEALDNLNHRGIRMDTCRVRAFPFGREVIQFVNAHDLVFVVEQNRDGQMRTLLINELQINPRKMVSVLYFAGLSISADTITEQISDYYAENKLSQVTEVQ
jgi:2-oxoglutarate ferredoxin oxidoreductase subunit alpha